MRNLVVDTNCLIQIISRHSPFRPIWDAFVAGKYCLCVSNEILEEYQEIIEQQTTARIAENVILFLLNKRNVKFVDPHFRMGLITEDPDDNKFVDCAFASNASFIVSDDTHYNVLHDVSFPKIAVIKLREFLNQITRQM